MNAVLVFNIIFVFIFLGLISMQFLLQQGMKKSLYLYRNPALIAGILFGTVFLISLYSYLVGCLLETNTLTLRYIFAHFVDFPDQFSKLALPVFAIVCILVIISNISLIRHEGFRPKNLLGVVIGLLFVGGSFGIYFLNDFVNDYILVPGKLADLRIAVTIHTYLNLFLTLVLCYLECFFIGTVIMAYIAARQTPTYDKDFIVILGCKIDKKGGLLPLLKGRTDRAIKFAWEQEIATGKKIRYVPSGGKGSDEMMSEASAMELYLLSHGAEADEVYPEKNSRTTYENFKFSKKIMDEINPEARVVFATTNYHIFRSGMMALKNGIFAEGIASKTKWYFWPNGFVREYFGILFMRLKAHLAVIGILGIGSIILGVIAFCFNVSWR